MMKSQKLQTSSNRASVTGMVMTTDRSRLVTAGLDKSVCVWIINRRNGVILYLSRLLKELLMKK